MGRIATFDEKTIYEALGRTLAVNGQARIASIQNATRLSAGSLYHRFGSREGLMADAWIFAIRAFQERTSKGFAMGGLDGAIEIALATPRFCRAEPDLAALLICGRPSEFLSDALTPKQKIQLEQLNVAAAKKLATMARRLGKSVLECRLALISFPLGAVRSFLPERPVPTKIDAAIRKAALAVLARARGS